MQPTNRIVSFLELDTDTDVDAFGGGSFSAAVRDASSDARESSRRDWWMSGADFNGRDYID